MITAIKSMFTKTSKQGRVLLPNQDESILVDVRTPEEFAAGNNPDSVNIPLSAIGNHIRDFKASGKKLVLICRSGARSGRATELLRSQGIEAFNGGPWDTFSFQ